MVIKEEMLRTVAQIFGLMSSNFQHERENAAHALHRKVFCKGVHPNDLRVVCSTAYQQLQDRCARVDLLEGLVCKLADERDAAVSERDAVVRSRNILVKGFNNERRKRLAAEKALAAMTKERDRAVGGHDPARRQKSNGSAQQTWIDDQLFDDSVRDWPPERIGEYMKQLLEERESRQQCIVGQVDLRLGFLVAVLYDHHAKLFGRRRRRSNAPTRTSFLELYGGKSASWLRRCHKAYLIYLSDEWPEVLVKIEGAVTIDAINKAARQIAKDARPVPHPAPTGAGPQSGERRKAA